jgi:hypothetical protein
MKMEEISRTGDQAILGRLVRIFESEATDFHEASELAVEMNHQVSKLIEAPALLTYPVLSVLAFIAACSPFSDIDEPNSQRLHATTPRQELCLSGIYELARLAYEQPETADRVVTVLNSIASTNKDYDLRHYAVRYLGQLTNAYNAATNDLALNSLRKQAMDNDNAWIRQLASECLASRTAPKLENNT